MNRSVQQDKLAVWLDDVRPMPAGFDVHVRTAQQAIELLRARKVSKISLDHDLGDVIYDGHKRVDPGDGYQVACAIEEMAYDGYPRIQVLVHSANPVGRRKMEEALCYAQKCWDDSESDEKLREV
jgi:hypothetical protein